MGNENKMSIDLLWRLFNQTFERSMKVQCALQVFLPTTLTPWSTVLLEKLTVPHLVKKFAAFYGCRMFITASTIARQLSLSRATAIQSMHPHLTSWRHILILSFHLRLVLQSCLFHSGLPIKPRYATLLSPIRATCPAHRILFGLITRIILDKKCRT